MEKLREMKDVKIAVTVTKCVQIGIETWKDVHVTKVFYEDATLKKIDEWILSVDKEGSLSSAKISDVVE